MVVVHGFDLKGLLGELYRPGTSEAAVARLARQFPDASPKNICRALVTYRHDETGAGKHLYFRGEEMTKTGPDSAGVKRRETRGAESSKPVTLRKLASRKMNELPGYDEYALFSNRQSPVPAVDVVTIEMEPTASDAATEEAAVPAETPYQLPFLCE